MIKLCFSYIFLNSIKKSMGFYYAVAKGRKPGIYKTWDECKTQVNGFSGPIYKKFSTKTDAEDFIQLHTNKKSLIKDDNSIKPTPSNKSVKSLKLPEMFALGNKKGSSTNSKNSNIDKKTESSQNLSIKRLLSVEENDRSTQPLLKKTKRETPNFKLGDYQKCINGYLFEMDNDGYVNVWTDGACSSNGNIGAQAGIGVYFGPNHSLNASRPVYGRVTNNNAEIEAVTEAAKRAFGAGVTDLKINTDSQFIIKCATKWIGNWKRNGWKTAKGAPVTNKQELQEMLKELSNFSRMTWNHVRGHCGHHGNEAADRLAREGASQNRL